MDVVVCVVVWSAGLFRSVLLFSGAVLGWSAMLKQGERVREMTPESWSREPKTSKKSRELGSWRGIGGPWGALRGQDGPLRLKMAAMRTGPAT